MKPEHPEQDYKQAMYRYACGFIAALALTYLIYFAATEQWFGRAGLAALILGLAAVQLVIQLVVFLHLGEKNMRLTRLTVIYGFIMMLIIVVASLWIMANMNYNMHMSPEQMNEFMLEQNKKGF